MKHFTTSPPSNCNDEDLQIKNDSSLTMSTYAIIKAKMSVLIPTLLDGPSTGDDVASRYEHVIHVDRQMRQLVEDIPSIILRHQDTLEWNSEWLALARRTLAIAAADKTKMTHTKILQGKNLFEYCITSYSRISMSLA
ncbi:hypothetical protein N0V90_005205 [Kalmusia sp. IMI 367209]|nr:hypothetical protein N0V90_005205 [Kalmusia sp. IMI 367209]